MWHFFLHITGADNGSWYPWWSGFGSDLAEFAILGGLISIYRKHNCHVKHCWRIGRHKVEGTEHIVCRKHHPNDTPTHAQVLADYQHAKIKS